MLISELTVYDFLKEKIKLPENDAKHFAKEIALAGERFDNKVEQEIHTKFKESDYITKEYFKLELDARLAQFEIRMQKGFKEIIFWLVGAMVGIVGLAVAILKFSN